MGFLAPAAAAVGSFFASTAGVATTAAIGAGSAIYGGIAKANQAKFMSQVAKNNAAIAKQNAEQSLIAGQAAESAQRAKTGRLIAAQLAVQGASGVDVAVGSPLRVRGADEEEGELDALTLRYNATRQAYGFGIDAQSQLAESSMYRTAAKNAMVQGFLGAGKSIIGGASSIGGSRRPKGRTNLELSGETPELSLRGY